MKKIIVAAAGLLLVANLHAAKKVTFTVNFGAVFYPFVNVGSFPGRFTLGGEVDVMMGSHWMLSPQFDILTIFSEWEYPTPGLVLNYRSSNFFVGAGAVCRIHSDRVAVAPIFNLGLFSGKLKLTFYVEPPLSEKEHIFNGVNVGVKVGYGF